MLFTDILDIFEMLRNPIIGLINQYANHFFTTCDVTTLTPTKLVKKKMSLIGKKLILQKR